MHYWQQPNRVVIGGRIANELTIRDIKSDSKILEFTIANNFKSTGETAQKSGHFFRCEAWGKTAEVIHKMFKKGDPILLDGSLHWSSWQDKESGGKRESVKIRVDNFFFGESSPHSSAPPPQTPLVSGNQKPTYYLPKFISETPVTETDNDIPM